MLLCLENENYPLLDVEKAHKDLEGAHQPYMVHEVEKLDMIIFSDDAKKSTVSHTIITCSKQYLHNTKREDPTESTGVVPTKYLPNHAYLGW